MQSPSFPLFIQLHKLRVQWRHSHQKGDSFTAQEIFKKATQLLQEALHSSPPKDSLKGLDLLQSKLDAYGREWEKLIAQSALIAPISFYSLLITTNLQKTESTLKEIEMRLSLPEPWGVLLFCESAPQPSSLSHLFPHSWTGIYHFILFPHRKPDELQLESIPGVLSFSFFFDPSGTQ